MQPRYILLVGEGNFSYSVWLSEKLLHGENLEKYLILQRPKLESNFKSWKLIATDYKSQDWMSDPKRNIQSTHTTLDNISLIQLHGHHVFLDVDCTKLETHEMILKYKDSISSVIFNFPHVQRKKMHIGLNRELLRKFFSSVSKLLGDERNLSQVTVHVALCKGQSGVSAVETVNRRWDDTWKIVEQASYGGFVLETVRKFETFVGKSTEEDSYSCCGYRNSLWKNFNLDAANVFIFRWRRSLNIVKNLELIDCAKSESFANKSNLEVDMDATFYCGKGCFLPEALPKEHPIFKHVNFFENHCLKYKFRNYTNTSPFFECFIENVPVKENCLDVLDKLVYLNNRPIGYIQLLSPDSHQLLSSDSIAAINLTELLKCFYSYNDERVMFSKFCSTDENNALTTQSIHSVDYSFDISFWVKTGHYKFHEPVFIKASLYFYGILLKNVKLLEIYHDPMDTSKISYCFRVVVNSIDHPFTDSLAHELYMSFRKFLEFHLDIVLR